MAASVFFHFCPEESDPKDVMGVQAAIMAALRHGIEEEGNVYALLSLPDNHQIVVLTIDEDFMQIEHMNKKYEAIVIGSKNPPGKIPDFLKASGHFQVRNC